VPPRLALPLCLTHGLQRGTATGGRLDHAATRPVSSGSSRRS
jgi:hypothetical protein